MWPFELDPTDATLDDVLIVATYEDDYHTYQAFGTTQANAALALNRDYQAYARKWYPQNVGRVITADEIAFAYARIGLGLVDGGAPANYADGFAEDFFREQGPTLVDQIENDPYLSEEDKNGAYPGLSELLAYERRSRDEYAGTVGDYISEE